MYLITTIFALQYGIVERWKNGHEVKHKHYTGYKNGTSLFIKPIKYL